MVWNNFVKRIDQKINRYEIIFILYIKLFTRHVLSANSSLKSCIKSTQVYFSQNPSERTSKSTIFQLQECVKFTSWLHFSQFWYSRDHSGKWMHVENTWYTCIQYPKPWNFSTSNIYACKVSRSFCNKSRKYFMQAST